MQAKPVYIHLAGTGDHVSSSRLSFHVISWFLTEKLPSFLVLHHSYCCLQYEYSSRGQLISSNSCSAGLGMRLPRYKVNENETTEVQGMRLSRYKVNGNEATEVQGEWE